MSNCLTVALCTHNRAALLRTTLERLLQSCSIGGCECEVLVVDNASTDKTGAILRDLSTRWPIRPLFESRPGLSNARNRAIEAANGDYIVWTDDDVLVAPTWIQAYATAFARHPRAAFFGGPVDPVFRPDAPAWLVEVMPAVRHAFAARDLGDRPLQFSAAILPFGANFAVKTDVQRQHPYNPELGQQPRRLMVGEETDVLRSMLESGETGWWVPEARVQHIIPEARQRWRYLGAYWYASGFHAGLSIPDAGGRHLFGKPPWLWKLALQTEIAYRLRRVVRSRVESVEQFAAARVAAGKLRAYRRASLARRGGLKGPK